MLTYNLYKKIMKEMQVFPKTAKEEEKHIKKLNKLGIECIGCKFEENKNIKQNVIRYDLDEDKYYY